MTATTVLLRTVVRICGADAAVVDSDEDLGAFGVSAAGAVELMACLRVRKALPDGLLLICQVPVPVAAARSSATLSIFGQVSNPLERTVRDVLIVIAAEIGRQLDMRTVAERERLGASFDGTIAHIAGGIDSLNDPAVILEWPRIGHAPRILYVNLAFESLFGYSAAAAIGQTPDLLRGPLTDTGLIDDLGDRLRETRQARSPIVYYRRDGVPIWVELSWRAVSGPAENSWWVVETLRDVTTRKEFERAIAKEKRKLQVTLAAIGDGVITTVADGRVDFVNHAARTIFGIDAADAYGQPIREVLHLTDSADGELDVLRAEFDASGVARGQARFGRGSLLKHIAFVTSPIADEGFVVVLRDVSAQHRLATQLSYEASHDSLTGMYNRRKFDELLVDAIEAAQRGDGPHALAFLDLDRFKFINDSCGHAAGDRVLLDLAHLVQQQLRGRDVLARIGGDEFAVLLHECSLDDARRVLEKLRVAVESYRFTGGAVAYSVGVSIGIAAIDESDTDAAAIFRRADAACYTAKGNGRNAIAG